jgi:hypothetical protein
MRKLVLTFTLLMAASLSIALFTNKCDNKGRLELFEDNVEALAQGEGVSGIIECQGEGGLYCPLNQKTIYRIIIISQ